MLSAAELGRGTVGVSRLVPVIGLAHGSRHPGVRPAVDALMSAVQAPSGPPAHAAFLDLTEPDLGAVAHGLAAERVTRAVVVPLLFTQAFHAGVDVPATVRSAAEASGVDLVVAGILGTGDDVLEVLAGAAAEARIEPATPILLFAVGSSNPSANAAVADLAARLEARRPGPVRAGFGTTGPRGSAVLEELTAEQPAAAVLPLFVSPGLLLEPMAHLARDRGWVMAPPLGTRLAPLVRDRYAGCDPPAPDGDDVVQDQPA